MRKKKKKAKHTPPTVYSPDFGGLTEQLCQSDTASQLDTHIQAHTYNIPHVQTFTHTYGFKHLQTHTRVCIQHTTVKSVFGGHPRDQKLVAF
jgi:hypothetical protein